MNKKTRTMVVAGVMALVVAMIFQMTGSPEAPTLPIGEIPHIEAAPSSQVVIAKTDILAFSPERIQKRMVEEVTYPAGLEPVNAARNTSEVLDKVATEDLYAKDIIILTRLSTPELLDQTLSQQLALHERAVTIQVDGVAAAGGFLEQGDEVDIIALYPQAGSTDLFCKTVMQGVKILAVGGEHRTQLRKNADGLIQGSAGAPINITVAAPAQEAFRIQHLKNRATFRMILKNPHDQDVTATDGDYYQKLLERNLPEHFRPKMTTLEKIIQIDVIHGVQQGTQPVVVPVLVQEEL